MNKNELVTAVAGSLELSKKECARVIDGVFDAIKAALARHEEVRLVDFGTFCAQHRKSTEGRNPRTGEKIRIPEAYVPKFKPGKGLREALARSR